MWIKTLNDTLEITYIILWSCSYYSQVYTTIKEKNGDGYSINFQIISLTSTIYLLIYSFYLLTKEINFITIMDSLYSLNCVIIILVQIILTFYYPRKINKIKLSPFLIIFFSLFFIAFYYFVGISYFKTDFDQFLLFIGFSKLNIAVVKYVFQIFLLYDRKNTYGMSIWNFFFDFFGAVLSLFQQFVGLFWVYDIESFNVTRFVLGVVTVFFDFVIFYQYFCLYKKRYNNLAIVKKEDNNRLMD